MRRVFAILLLAFATLALAVAGCGRLTGKLTGVRKPNQAPHTVLFVSGDLDTVNHVVHLFWFGSDPDGSVKGFEWKLLNPATPADDAWHFTTHTDSIFTVQAPNGYIATSFSVRAVDDAGLVDANPPVQDLQFKNDAPTVRLVQKPLATDTTFASVTVGWTSTDQDGDVNKLRYLVWLDGRRDTPEITTLTQFTMPSDRFLVNGSVTTGPRKLFVQAIDDGGRASTVDSVSWIVRRPVTGTRPRLLIVDDVPPSNTSNARYDSLYTNSATRVGLASAEYAVLRLDRTQPFKSAKDVEQTFKLFESVIWYRGAAATTSNVLSLVEPGIEAYVESGGNFFLEGMYLFGANGFVGSLSEDFVTRTLRSRLVRQFSLTVRDSVAGFGNTNPATFTQRLDVGGGLIDRTPFTFAGIYPVISSDGGGGGLREFADHDTNEVVLWAEPGSMSPANPARVPVGLSVPQTGGGRAVVLGVPIVVLQANNGGVAAFVTNLLRHFGLDRP